MTNWQDKNGKSFIYDERGHIRLLQIRGEKEVDNHGKPYIMFGIQANYPAKDLEFDRPFGYNSYETGPTVVVEVPKSVLGEDKDNAERFALLDKLEDFYKKDLLGEQQGISRLVKQFITDSKGIDFYSMEARGQTAVYFQNELQGLVNQVVKERAKEKAEAAKSKAVKHSFAKVSRNGVKPKREELNLFDDYSL